MQIALKKQVPQIRLMWTRSLGVFSDFNVVATQVNMAVSRKNATELDNNNLGERALPRSSKRPGVRITF
tara:strand:+ start:244338 stop:244544 length:207 start_codon:yes stop_codon:yes gene_type:complete